MSDRASQLVNVSVQSGGDTCRDVPPESFGVVTWQQNFTSDAGGAATGSSITAQFLQGPAIGFAYPPVTSVPSVDNWGFLPLTNSFCAGSYPATLSAGPITVTLPGLSPVSLEPQNQNGLLAYQATLSSGTLQAGSYSIAGLTAASVVGPFAGAASIPAPIAITTDLLPGTAVTLPFTLNWTGGASDSLVTVQLIARVAGQLASPELWATSPASAGARTLAPPPTCSGIPVSPASQY